MSESLTGVRERAEKLWVILIHQFDNIHLVSFGVGPAR